MNFVVLIYFVFDQQFGSEDPIILIILRILHEGKWSKVKTESLNFSDQTWKRKRIREEAKKIQREAILWGIKTLEPSNFQDRFKV